MVLVVREFVRTCDSLIHDPLNSSVAPIIGSVIK